MTSALNCKSKPRRVQLNTFSIRAADLTESKQSLELIIYSQNSTGLNHGEENVLFDILKKVTRVSKLLSNFQRLKALPTTPTHQAPSARNS